MKAPLLLASAFIALLAAACTSETDVIEEDTAPITSAPVSKLDEPNVATPIEVRAKGLTIEQATIEARAKRLIIEPGTQAPRDPQLPVR